MNWSISMKRILRTNVEFLKLNFRGLKVLFTKSQAETKLPGQHLLSYQMTQQDSEAALSEDLLANARNGSQVQAPEHGCKQTVAINDWSWCGTRVPKNQVTLANTKM